MTMTLKTSAIPQITWIKTTAKLMGILTTRAMGEGMVLDTQSKVDRTKPLASPIH